MKRMKWIILIFIVATGIISSCMVLDQLFDEMLNTSQSHTIEQTTRVTNQNKT